MCSFLDFFVQFTSLIIFISNNPIKQNFDICFLRLKDEVVTQFSTEENEYSETSNNIDDESLKTKIPISSNNSLQASINKQKQIFDSNDGLKSVYKSPEKVELSSIKPFKLIKKPQIKNLQIDEFAFMVRPNERMIGIESFVVPELERLNLIYLNISAGSEILEGEGSIQDYKYKSYGHYSFPGYIKDEIVSKEVYLRTIPYARYTPLFIEVRGSSYNAALHGIYKREDSMQLSQKNDQYPWYVEPIIRPVYKRISSEPNLFVFFLNHPIERWCIGDTWPITNPKINVGQIYAEILGRPYSPVFSKGWYVQPRKYGAHDIVPYIELDPSTPLRNPLPVKIPKEMESKRILVFDKDLVVEEARPFTFIPHESLILEHIPLVDSPDNFSVFSGCPNVHLSKFSGITKYDTPTCIPPLSGTLDILLNGANGYFSNALFSWEGYFKKRPYFVQRGPLRSEDVTLKSSIVEQPGNSQYLWSHVDDSKNIIWMISNQLGNISPSQVLVIWKRPNSSRVKSSADWPAERGIELEPDGWSFYKHPNKKKYLHNLPNSNYIEEKTFIRINGIKPKFIKMVINGGPEDLNGDYFYLGEYLGFPFFRQKRNKKRSHPGYVMYRGTSITRTKDTWVIGTTLGSIHGIKAYAIDYNHSDTFNSRSGFQYYGGTRWPHQLPIRSWRIWAPSDDSIKINIYNKEMRGANSENVARTIEFKWKRFESMYITMEYLDPIFLFKQHLSPVIGIPNKESSNNSLVTNNNAKQLDLSEINHKAERDQIHILEDSEDNLTRNIEILDHEPSTSDFSELQTFTTKKAEKKSNWFSFIKIVGVTVPIIVGIVIWMVCKLKCYPNNPEVSQDSILGIRGNPSHPSYYYLSKVE
ncbi:membrane associated protein, transmembrane domain near C-terminus [Cryptosporidium felis]|nr:membrane associated protein, transmembrane domain near C-terminus [Cryptosporidium felis]